MESRSEHRRHDTEAMTGWARFRLDQHALAFMRTRLAAGKALASLRLREVVLDAGEIATCLPHGTNAAAMTRFEAGGMPPVGDAPTPGPFEGHPVMAQIPNADAIFVGAYEGEGCLFRQRFTQ